MKIVLASHGHFAMELLHSAEMICGKQKGINVIEFTPGEDLQELKSKFSQYINNTEETLIITDVFGGTPYNVAAGLTLQNNLCTAISGVSLPMLLDILTMQTTDGVSVKNLVDTIWKNKANYIRSSKESANISELEEL